MSMTLLTVLLIAFLAGLLGGQSATALGVARLPGEMALRRDLLVVTSDSEP